MNAESLFSLRPLLVKVKAEEEEEHHRRCFEEFSSLQRYVVPAYIALWPVSTTFEQSCKYTYVTSILTQMHSADCSSMSRQLETFLQKHWLG